MEDLRRVEVSDILRARDERAQRQQAFLAAHHAPLISFTMNIAGAIKRTPDIQRAFLEGVQLVNRQLERMRMPALAYEETLAFTGCEALWAVQGDADELKKRMCLIEEHHALGRLFDLDVITADGTHLSRENERTCLLCSGPVRACARSRTHTAEELFARAQEMIRQYEQKRFVQTVGELAQKALFYEALTTPKPGLVDRENNGAHRDMDLFRFADSTCALRPYFERCVRLGLEGSTPDALQFAGMQAEDAMTAAAGVNTHKGAIFSLGILCHALGRAGQGAPLADVLEKAAETGAFFLNRMPKASQAHTGGERQYHQYGLTGARGEAASGFQTVTGAALPALEQALEQGKTFEEASLQALLTLIAQVQDSNIIRRAGREGQEWACVQARAALENGFDRAALKRLDEQFIQKNISPGGSADLLAAACFLYWVGQMNP